MYKRNPNRIITTHGTFADAEARGFKAGMLDALRGGFYRAAPVRIQKSVGSLASDATARYHDVGRFKIDVRRGEHELAVDR